MNLRPYGFILDKLNFKCSDRFIAWTSHRNISRTRFTPLCSGASSNLRSASRLDMISAHAKVLQLNNLIYIHSSLHNQKLTSAIWRHQLRICEAVILFSLVLTYLRRSPYCMYWLISDISSDRFIPNKWTKLMWLHDAITFASWK